MAKPRIFVSSTYYDLKYVRSDLERFIKEQGFESILNEKGNIPYGSDKKLEEYCYKEIELCDILISVVGGRFGSESKDIDYSISNLELKAAIEKGKQVYVFIDRNVASEYKTFQANKDIKEIKYTAVDDIRVYKFLEEIDALPLNNQIKSFESTSEIISYLREQWAGLFQRLLSESAKHRENSLLDDIKNTSKTLNQLVNYLIDEKLRGDQAIKDILLSNHPAFEDLRKKISIPYRVIFQNKKELTQLLKGRQFIEEDIFDGWSKAGFHSWKQKTEDSYLRVSEYIFDDDGKLKIFTPSEWSNDYISYEEVDDIPF